MTATREYWNERYSSDEPARASGTFVHEEAANRWFYRAKSDRIGQILRSARIDWSNASVLDAACGTGAFVPLWLKRGARRVVGLDLSDKAVRVCRDKFSGSKPCQFRCFDLSSPTPEPRMGGFDLVVIFEAIFLLTGKNDFLTALEHLCSWLNPGGYLLISDHFPTSTIVRHERLTYHSRSTYESVFKKYGVQVIGLFQQSRLFNRRIFPQKIQELIETKSPGTLYRLNRQLIRAPAQNSNYRDEIYYCLARKVSGGMRNNGRGGLKHCWEIQ